MTGTCFVGLVTYIRLRVADRRALPGDRSERSALPSAAFDRLALGLLLLAFLFTVSLDTCSIRISKGG